GAGWLADRYGISAALLICVPGSWTLLWLSWLPFYRTYPRDAERLRAAMRERRSELIGDDGAADASGRERRRRW
ncbi:MAG: hypothetical protein GX605_11475, partial [Chloroflexi bacterium]|nr:hypothetical protein [Chloroflexota bacterium]